MYAAYSYSNAQSYYEGLRDITKLCCGETVKANLSAGCTALEIYTSASTAGWSLFDIQANTTGPTTSWTKNSAPAWMTTLTHTSGALDGSTTDWGTIYYRYVYATNSHTLKFYKSAADRTADTNAIASGTLSAATGTMTLTGTTGWTQVFVATPSAGTVDGTITTSYNAFMLRAPFHADNGGAAAGYNYVKLDLAVNAGYLAMNIYESWNNTTHVGGNGVTASNVPSLNTYSCKFSPTVGGNLYLSVKGGQSIIPHSLILGVWGSTSLNTITTAFVERTRWSPWDTVANGYPVGMILQGYTVANAPFCYAHGSRYAVPITGDVTPSYSYVGTIFGVFVAAANPLITVCLDENKQQKHILLPFICSNGLTGFLGGDLSALTDLWCTAQGYGSPLDELVVNGNTYVIFPGYQAGRFAVRKG